MERFETGKTYSTRSACDYECVFSFTVTKRTAKTVWLRDHSDNRILRRRVQEWSADGESAAPYGRYSMAPVINADRPDA